MAAPLEAGPGPRSAPDLAAGALRPVPVRAVEGELTRLWEQAARTRDAPGGPGALRARTMNLVVCAGAGADPADLTLLLAEIMAAHPCRALLLLEEPGGGAGVRATLGPLCHRAAAGGALVCGEQVLLAAGGEGRRAAAGAALSLLVPDLPVILWWRGGAPEADERFARLADVADRILLDSARLGGAGPGLGGLADLVERYRSAALGDLQWGRLTPWRSLTAQFFDPPEMRPYLTRLAEVTMAFGPAPSGRGQALLYTGWLGGRLGWRGTGEAWREADGTMEATLAREGGAVRLLLTPGGAGSAEGLVGVTIVAEGEPPARFRLERAADGVCVVTEAEHAGRPILTRTVCIEEPGEAALVEQDLRLPGRDRIFEEALRAAAALAPR